MKITVESNLDIWSDRTEMEIDSNSTLREVLQTLSQKLRFPLIDAKSGELDFFIVLRVNKKEYFLLPHGLETHLNDGDVVEIAVTVAAGG